MKLPKEQLNELVSGMVELLAPANQVTASVKKVKGMEIIKQGVYTDNKGKQIDPFREYVYEREIRVKINHKKRILSIIDESDNLEVMNDRLGQYLAKYASNPLEVMKSIPDHLRTQNPAE